MIKAKLTRRGQPHLIIGLSHRNLELLKENRPITFNIREIGFDQDLQIFIFSAENEDKMKKALADAGLIHPLKTVMIDDNAEKN